MDNTKHYTELSRLIDKFNIERNTMTVAELQTIREDISLTFFYLADFSAKCIANFEAKEYERKRYYATKEEEYRNEIDERTGRKHTVSDSERLTRISAKKIDDETSEALRQKEKMRVINMATQQILNSLSSRITQLSK